MGELNGKRIIVTGAASGMGGSAAQAFIAAGASVAALDIAVAPDTATQGNSRRDYRCDVSSRASVDAAFAEAVDWLGGLDALVHAAGIQQYKPAETLTDEDLNRILGVNLFGTIYTNQAAFPHLKDKGGRIINFSSASGIKGTPKSAHYNASKGAVGSWTRTLAQEWAEYQITVNAIAPVIMTAMAATTLGNLSPEEQAVARERMKVNVPLGGWFGDADRDLAPFLVFLVGEGSRFMTGQTFAVDGGCVMMSA
ncbi:SDR family oxidoreductase [soil metagenome]